MPTYTVMNPREVPKGDYLLRHQVDPKNPETDIVWYEGDTFDKPKTMPASIVKQWVSRGLLKEKAG